MGIDINTYFPGLNDCKIDIEKLFQREKMSPSDITQEELLETRNKNYEEEQKIGAAENFWAGLYSSTSSGTIDLNANSKVSPAAIMDDYTFTDPQFIDNFVAKECFFEDRIKEKYSGKDLEDRLSELEKDSNEVIDRLSGAFAQGIGDFMNGNLGWLYDSYLTASSPEGTNNNFNVKEFQSHIKDAIKSQKQVFENIKAQNPDEWEKVINNYGDGLDKFTNKLKATTNSTSTSSTGNNKLEDMSYSDIEAVGKVIHSLGGGIYTNSSETLGAYLGQMKLKSDIMLDNINISSNVRDALSKAVSQNIAQKIISFSRNIKLSGGIDQKTMNSFVSLAKLAKTDLNQFRTQYLENMTKLYNSLLGNNQYTELPYSNTVGYASSIVSQQIDDWNSFLNQFSIPKDKTELLYVNGLNGNLVDAKS